MSDLLVLYEKIKIHSLGPFEWRNRKLCQEMREKIKRKQKKKFLFIESSEIGIRWEKEKKIKFTFIFKNWYFLMPSLHEFPK